MRTGQIFILSKIQVNSYMYNKKNQINWLWPLRDTVKYVIQVELPFTTMANENWQMNGGGGQMGKIV